MSAFYITFLEEPEPRRPNTAVIGQSRFRRASEGERGLFRPGVKEVSVGLEVWGWEGGMAMLPSAVTEEVDFAGGWAAIEGVKAGKVKGSLIARDGT